MKRHLYICEYCFKEYKPRRRHIQKYCSNTCRVKAFYQRHKGLKKVNDNLPATTKAEPKLSKEKISMAGVGNAAIANVATDVLKNIFIPEDSKPATKGDLKKLLAQFKERYEKVKNIAPRQDGSEAYYDNVEKRVVYLKMKPLKNLF